MLQFLMKRHDTRPRRVFYLIETDPANTANTRPVDLTNVASARFCARDLAGVIAFTSVLAINTPATAGALTYTPVAFDTAVADTFQCEIELTFADGGVETYPNNGYFTMIVYPDLCA